MVKFIWCILSAYLLERVRAVFATNYEIIATPSVTASEFIIWNYTYLIDDNTQYRTVSLERIQTGAISGTVSTLYKELDSNGWVFIGDLSGNVHSWQWNPATNQYEEGTVTPSLAGQGVYMILGTSLSNGSGVVTLQTGDLMQEQWDLNPDGSIASRSSAYLYDQSTCQAMAADGYYLKGPECAINCSQIPNTAENADLATCSCQPGYYWDGQHCSKYEDLLLLQDGVVWDSVSAMFSLPNCTTDATLPQCNCTAIQYWYAINQSCLYNCTGLPFATGVTDSGCSCQAGMVWNAGVGCQMNCSNTSNSNGTNVNATECYCNGGYKWNVTAADCWVYCSNKTNSNQTNYNATQCQCDSGSKWNGTTLECQVDCTGAANSDGTNVNSTHCNCNTGYGWNTTSGACWLNCSNATTLSTRVNFNATVCLCGPNYIWNSSTTQCIVNCANMSNSNYSNLNATQCYCNNNSFWNTSANHCYINCTGLLNSSGFNFNADQCECSTGFLWDNSTNECWINCYTQPNSNGINLNRTTCLCNPGTILNDSTNFCQPFCKGQNHSNGSNINSTFCFCDQHYTWNDSSSDCWLDCSLIPHSTISIDIQVCSCKDGYIWREQLCWYDCSIVSNSPKTSRDPDACNCNSKYYWNATENQCLVDCSFYEHTNGSNPVNSSDCLCLDYFIKVSGACSVNCQQVPYSLSIEDGSEACLCEQDYTWDSILKACLSDSKTKNDATAVGVGVGVGAPVTIGVVTVVAVIAASVAPAAAAPAVVASTAAVVATTTATTATTVTTATTATTATAATTATTGATTATTGATTGAAAPVAVKTGAATTAAGGAQGINATAPTAVPNFAISPVFVVYNKKTAIVLMDN